MSNLFKAIISGLIFCIAMTGCSRLKPVSNSISGIQTVSTIHSTNNSEAKQYKYFELPNKIILISKGKVQKTIAKEDDLYSKVLNATEKRFPATRLDTLLCMTTQEELKILENNYTVLEFIYTESKQTEYKGLVPSIRKYNRILMPLNGKYKNYFYTDEGKSETFSPIVNLFPPDDLINLLK